MSNPCPDPILVDASLLNLGRPVSDGLFFSKYSRQIVHLWIASVTTQSALTARNGRHTVNPKLGLNGWGITVRRGRTKATLSRCKRVQHSCPRVRITHDQALV